MKLVSEKEGHNGPVVHAKLARAIRAACTARVCHRHAELQFCPTRPPGRTAVCKHDVCVYVVCESVRPTPNGAHPCGTAPVPGVVV